MSQLTIPRALKKYGNALSAFFECNEGFDRLALIEMFEETYIGTYGNISEYVAKVLTDIGIYSVTGLDLDFECMGYNWNRNNLIKVIKRCNAVYVFQAAEFDKLEINCRDTVATAKEQKAVDLQARSVKSKQAASRAFDLRNELVYHECCTTAYDLQVEADNLRLEARELRISGRLKQLNSMRN